MPANRYVSSNYAHRLLCAEMHMMKTNKWHIIHMFIYYRIYDFKIIRFYQSGKHDFACEYGSPLHVTCSNAARDELY